jgi:heterodisulfide reductase subunit A
MGVEFIRAKVASIKEDEGQNPVLRLEMMEEGSQVVERTHDLVVLSVGLQPAYNPAAVYGIPIAKDGFVSISTPNLNPCSTDRPGIFATGTAAGPMDIVDSIVMAGATAAATAAYLNAGADVEVYSVEPAYAD